MKKFFRGLFGRKKDAVREAPVAQVSFVANKCWWEGQPGVCRYLGPWTRPTTVPITLDICSRKYWEDLKEVVFAAQILCRHAEFGFGWEFRQYKDYVLKNLASKKVLFRVWPTAKFLDPESAEFFDVLCFAAASGQPVEIFCKWAE